MSLAYKIISFIDDMLFTLTDYNRTKITIFNDGNYSNTNRKAYRLIDDFFNLTCMQINLSTCCHTKNANKIVLSTIFTKSESNYWL